MSKINKYLRLSKKFAKKYTKEYLLLMAKPILVGLVGFMFVQFALKNPFFIFFVFLITFPCIFWAFWKGYVITYALNYAAYDFYDNENDYTLLDFIEQNKNKEKNLALYLSFCAIVSIILFLPTILSSVSILGALFTNPAGIMTMLNKFVSTFVIFLINSIILIPFINFMTQAYFFKKDHENFSDAFINCYKYLNKDGVIIAIAISIISSLPGLINPVLQGILMLLLNTYFYSINTFWFYDRVNKKK